MQHDVYALARAGNALARVRRDGWGRDEEGEGGGGATVGGRGTSASLMSPTRASITPGVGTRSSARRRQGEQPECGCSSCCTTAL